MSSAIQFQTNNNLTCNKGGLHSGELLNQICIDPKCEKKGLYCSICLYEDHQSHQKFPLKQFLANIQQGFTNAAIDEDKIEEFLEKIERLQECNLYNLKQCIQKIAEQIKEMEENLISTYRAVKEKIVSQNFLSKNAPEIINQLANGDYADSSKAQEDCKRLIENIKMKQKKIYFDFEPEKVKNQFEKNENTLKQKLEQFQKSVSESIDGLNKVIKAAKSDNMSLCDIQFEPSSNVTFNSAKWVTCEDTEIKFKYRSESSYTHINSKQTFSKEDKVQLRFQITNYNYHNPSHFWLGICLDKDKNNNFWKSTGNQIDLQQKSQNWKSSWIVDGKFKNFGEFMKKDVIFNLEFCVNENLLKVYDDDKQIVCTSNTNSVKLNNQGTASDKWVIVMGTHKSDVHIQLL